MERAVVCLDDRWSRKGGTWFDIDDEGNFEPPYKDPVTSSEMAHSQGGGELGPV
jgi:hypothetical protein